jgi:hypothetical protein
VIFEKVIYLKKYAHSIVNINLCEIIIVKTCRVMCPDLVIGFNGIIVNQQTLTACSEVDIAK